MSTYTALVVAYDAVCASVSLIGSTSGAIVTESTHRGVLDVLSDREGPMSAENGSQGESGRFNAVLDMIDAALATGPVDDYTVDRYPRCPYCGHQWHGMRCDDCGCKGEFATNKHAPSLPSTAPIAHGSYVWFPNRTDVMARCRRMLEEISTSLALLIGIPVMFGEDEND